jgi:hypothetical protein
MYKIIHTILIIGQLFIVGNVIAADNTDGGIHKEANSVTQLIVIYQAGRFVSVPARWLKVIKGVDGQKLLGKTIRIDRGLLNKALRKKQ